MRCPVHSRRLLAVVLLLIAPLLAAARGTAFPHLALKRSEPEDQSRLSAPPQQISLWFTAKPQLAFSRITLAGPTGGVTLATIVADTGNVLHHYRIGQHVAASLALFASVALLFWYVLRLVMALSSRD